jgi:hypothetical protein
VSGVVQFSALLVSASPPVSRRPTRPATRPGIQFDVRHGLARYSSLAATSERCGGRDALRYARRADLCQEALARHGTADPMDGRSYLETMFTLETEGRHG